MPPFNSTETLSTDVNRVEGAEADWELDFALWTMCFIPNV